MVWTVKRNLPVYAQTQLQKSNYSPFYTLQSAVGWFQAHVISLGLAENSCQEQTKISKNKIVRNTSNTAK